MQIWSLNLSLYFMLANSVDSSSQIHRTFLFFVRQPMSSSKLVLDLHHSIAYLVSHLSHTIQYN